MAHGDTIHAEYEIPESLETTFILLFEVMTGGGKIPSKGHTRTVPFAYIYKWYSPT